MANITLGQTIAGSISSSDSITVDKFQYFDDYDLPSLAGFSQIDIKLEPAAGLQSPYLQLINAATGAVVAQSYPPKTGSTTSTLTLAQSTLPGINYKIRVAGGYVIPETNKELGNYQISVTDAGKGTSIVSLDSGYDFNSFSGLGTVGQNGTYYNLGGAGGNIHQPVIMKDVTQTANGQFYTIALNTLFRIDPSLSTENQRKRLGDPTSFNGSIIDYYSLESANNKLYAIGLAETGTTLYQIDAPNDTKPVVTILGALPAALTPGGDLVFDAANNRFLATNKETATSDALWQIPLASPAGATKIGSIGVSGVNGLSFEGSQLFGYVGGTGTNVNRLKIDIATGAGTVDKAITGVPTLGISGGSTIFNSTTYPASQSGLSIADFKKNPVQYMGSIRDYDGNNLGGSTTWKSIGEVDINGDGTTENILVNPKIERFASVGSVGGNVDFTKYGLNGDTRVVGIYLDPTLTNSPEKRGGPFDSQRRFQNDLKIDNLSVLAAGDYNKDGFQDLYFKLGDGSAVLRCLMFKDGNIQYANYQSKTDLAAFMNANNVNQSVWGSWL